MASFFVYRGMIPPRFVLGFVLAALACWGLAALLLACPEIAAVLASCILIPAGLAFFGIGLRVWRSGAALHGQAAPPPPGPGDMKDVDVTVRDDEA